jgi:hypothetical protein
MMLEEVSVGTVCVCLWLGVREWSSGKFGGESGETFGKEGKGKEGFAGDSGDMGRPRENKTGAGCTGSARTTENTCKSVTGDNGCGALSWKRESARLASFKVAESRARHLCWERQVGSQPMEANIRPCEYT